MKKYLYDYIDEIDNLLESDKKIGEDTIKNHLIKISFFQHERLIHLFVTMFYMVMFLLFTALGCIHYIFLVIMLIALVFVICYVIHYFRLENGVQYLYKQYDMMLQKNQKKGIKLFDKN